MVRTRKPLQHYAFLLALAMVVPRSLAQITAPVPEGIDLVVMVDHSGSMWGLKEIVGDQKNDPYGHRISIVKRAVARLLSDVEKSNRVHQVAVIDFGNDARTSLPITPIKAKKANNWQLYYEGILASIHGQELRNTNTAAAFELAEQNISKMMANLPGKHRRQVLLLVTDGRPAMPNIAKSTLKDRITASMNGMRSRGAELWVLAIDDQLGYWDGKEETFWTKLTPKEQASKADPIMPNLPQLIDDYVDKWLKIKTTAVKEDHFFCPPYLSKLKVMITTNADATSLQLKDPAGNTLTPLYRRDADKNIYYEISDPIPGSYRIETDSSDLIATRIETLPYQLARFAPTGPVDPGSTTNLGFEVLDDAGKVLTLDPKFPVDPVFSITGPDGTTNEQAGNFKDPKRLRFNMPWTPPQAGSWQVVPKGLVRLPTGDTVDILEGVKLGPLMEIEVSDRQPYYLGLKTPKPNQGFRVIPGASKATVVLELLDAERKPVEELDGIVDSPTSWLSLQVLDKNGVAAGDAMPLQMDANGRFKAEIPLNVDWLAGKGTLFADETGLRVYAVDDRMNEDVYLHSLWLPKDLAGHRAEGIPLSFQPIPIGMPFWIWCLIAILVGCLLFLVSLWLATRIVPNLMTARRDSKAQRRPGLVFYDEREDPGGIGGTCYPIEGAAHHKLDRKVRLDLGDKDKVAQRFRVKRILSGKTEMARIEYRWISDSKGKKQPMKKATVKLGKVQRLDGIPGRNYVVKFQDLNQT